MIPADFVETTAFSEGLGLVWSDEPQGYYIDRDGEKVWLSISGHSGLFRRPNGCRSAGRAEVCRSRWEVVAPDEGP